ncbi:hypothetical protein F1880_002022 [Penicillium rolfsii]|nr:hypothetical protein F1880_002022 [Penicillium rolfsii]
MYRERHDSLASFQGDHEAHNSPSTGKTHSNARSGSRNTARGSRAQGKALVEAGVNVKVEPEVLSALLPAVHGGKVVPETTVIQTVAVAQYDEDALA